MQNKVNSPTDPKLNFKKRLSA